LAVPFAELSQMARRHVASSDEPLLAAQLSLIDAANYAQRLQGGDLFLAGGSLSREDLADGRNLPGFVRTFREEQERGIRRFHPPDRLWELAYGALLTAAQEARSAFLLSYVPWEIELRNRLAVQRLRDRAGGGEGRLVFPELQRFDFTALLAQLEGITNPLTLERTLDRERLRRIRHDQGTDPFSRDSLLAYLAGALLYERWQKMTEPYDMNQYLYGGG
jgi:hypothetical protein